MKEIGEFLKNSRIHNGVSLEEASEDLNLSVLQLENIEEGNVRAFKDVFTLRELVKDYAKYLGIEIDQVMEEFNDFMFEHTSKISLTDIIEARVAKAPQETEKDKVASPYTRIKSKKNWNLKPIIIGLAILLFLLIVVFVIIQFMDKEDVVTSELMGNKEEVFRL
ncbi:MAG TPA: helix-turn-helix domain-containing protein [Candidatus Scybalousia intestinigallinarum]|nr:helix-turn-helix domain-containing protein [Candidatus Scybalousia intestinigallinarum]